jgi:ribonuclease-3
MLENLPDVDDLRDPKTRLQEWLQARKLALPDYELVNVTGMAHQQTFAVTCTVNELSQTTHGESTTRQKAEQKSARDMFRRGTC